MFTQSKLHTQTAQSILRSLGLACWCALAPGLALAQAPDPALMQSDLKRAGELQLEGKNKDAITLYESLIDRGADSADLLFNLGNAQLAAGAPAKAALRYEQALRLEPGAADIEQNLRLARSRLSAKPAAPEGALSLAELLDPIVSWLPPSLFAVLAVLGSAALFFALAVRSRLTEPERRRQLSLFAAAALALLLVSGAVTWAHAEVAADPRAVVLKDTTLKEGPNPRFEDRRAVPAGARVRVKSEDGAWVEVQEPGGSTGWMLARRLNRV